MYKTEITLDVNNEQRTVYVRNADLLLDVLREPLGLTGAKPGCLNGDCGTCTIEVDGETMKACLMLAVEAVGKKITTIEGLKGTLVQGAFIEKFAFQCGYCTPGFIINCHTLLQKYPTADDTVIKDWLESNICRCTGYQEIEEAVKAVQDQLKNGSRE
ncbi:(2Fe-2S)-binding protein [Halalkalibacterium halodurans]|uniref:(2Fe-2S)-binding protein n=1 Tax=Halalkalibacterium halodurans TaxID=86665 RepID=UPI002AAA3C07|nr:(2Fe-2S)-binding protein [Halalkalibacterium halodurans]MDY7222538.1 (2Fe-2S)-binding protein [Halalkalibacterium halodurans]MDY7241759.1 (2Fe-2S)-binding protein [Halalkalibacterium halodurans]